MSSVQPLHASYAVVDHARRAQQTAAYSLLAVVIGLLTAISINQGVAYYIVRFTVGLPYKSPLFVLGLLTVAVGLALLATRKARPALPYLVLFAALNLYFCVTALYAPRSVFGMTKLLQTGWAPVLFFAAGLVIAALQKEAAFARSCVAIATIMALVYLARGHTPAMLSGVVSSPLIINYQNFGLAVGLAVLGLLYLLPSIKRPGVRYAVVAFTLALLLLGLGSGSRSVILVAGGGALFMYGLDRGRALFVVAAAIAAVVVYLLIEPHIVQFAREIWADPEAPSSLRRTVWYAVLSNYEQTTSLTGRKMLAGLAYQLGSANPLFGVGWGGYALSAGLPDMQGIYPHNIVAEIWAETGVLGLGATLAVVGHLLISSRRATDRWNLRFAWSLFAAGMLAAWVTGDWPSQKVLFVALGLMAGGLAHGGGRSVRALLNDGRLLAGRRLLRRVS